MASDIASLVFDRRPYTVYYQDMQGAVQTLKRTPAPKLHEALPTDTVELLSTKSDDFRAGDVMTVQHINPRYPNTLQLRNGSGDTTFVEYLDVNLKNEVAPRQDGRDPMDQPSVKTSNRYLMWP
ncbi:MAG: hypothetical protein FJ146_00590 [Deltaproteobacteria bacterium]|nr:hypothetical protein [Deltaproteobacteria bacterium]